MIDCPACKGHVQNHSTAPNEDGEYTALCPHCNHRWVWDREPTHKPAAPPPKPAAGHTVAAVRCPGCGHEFIPMATDA